MRYRPPGKLLQLAQQQRKVLNRVQMIPSVVSDPVVFDWIGVVDGSLWKGLEMSELITRVAVISPVLFLSITVFPSSSALCSLSPFHPPLNEKYLSDLNASSVFF